MIMDKKWCKFCEQWVEDSPDILTVLEIKAITGYCKTSVQGWIDRGLIKAFLTGRSNKIPKSSLLEFMSSSKFYNMHVKSKKLKAKLQKFERITVWGRGSFCLKHSNKYMGYDSFIVDFVKVFDRINK